MKRVCTLYSSASASTGVYITYFYHMMLFFFASMERAPKRRSAYFFARHTEFIRSAEKVLTFILEFIALVRAAHVYVCLSVWTSARYGVTSSIHVWKRESICETRFDVPHKSFEDLLTAAGVGAAAAAWNTCSVRILFFFALTFYFGEILFGGMRSLPGYTFDNIHFHLSRAHSAFQSTLSVHLPIGNPPIL